MQSIMPRKFLVIFMYECKLDVIHCVIKKISSLQYFYWELPELALGIYNYTPIAIGSWA